jgi:hypothetical protein
VAKNTIAPRPRKRRAPVVVEPAPSWPGRVWEAYRGLDLCDCTFVGYLISDAADPHRPIALLPTWSAESRAGNRTGKPYDRLDAFTFARRVAERPEVLDQEVPADYFVRDLRPFCRPDSIVPFPAELYALRLGYVDAGGFDTFAISPFCRFRFARMVAAFCGLAFSPEEVRDHPAVSVMLQRPREDPRDEGGPFVSAPVLVTPSEIPL